MNQLLAVFFKAAREQGRDRLGLTLTLLTAPFFVLFYWVVFLDSETAQPIAVLAAPGQDPAPVVRALSEIEDEQGRALLRPRRATDEARVRQQLERGELACAVELPEGFLEEAGQAERTPSVKLIGDVSSARWRQAAPAVTQALQSWRLNQAQMSPPLIVEREALGRSARRTDFEAYVPNLLVFAVIMLVFSSSMAVAREAERGTLTRIMLTPLPPWRYLLGVGAFQAVLGVASVALTFGVAWALGFRARGSAWLAVAAASLAGLSCVGLGVLVASLARSVTRAFLIGSFFMFLLMLFSGLIFPIPRVELLTLGGRAIGPFELLPTVHAARALQRVLTLGAGPAEVAFELIAMLILAALNFAAGWALFVHSQRRLAAGEGA